MSFLDILLVSGTTALMTTGLMAYLTYRILSRGRGGLHGRALRHGGRP